MDKHGRGRKLNAKVAWKRTHVLSQRRIGCGDACEAGVMRCGGEETPQSSLQEPLKGRENFGITNGGVGVKGGEAKSL